MTILLFPSPFLSFYSYFYLSSTPIGLDDDAILSLHYCQTWSCFNWISEEEKFLLWISLETCRVPVRSVDRSFFFSLGKARFTQRSAEETIITIIFIMIIIDRISPENSQTIITYWNKIHWYTEGKCFKARPLIELIVSPSLSVALRLLINYTDQIELNGGGTSLQERSPFF